ncbi:hypothetical protein [Brachybacterium alimentarium]|uniref:hypothetical protein n=1 Tax=Brachybacterium alimentarium TaxID=47845 RepID=UPI000DF488D9|nr:hypothetical protein [Brachybacterium alimentarium]RCS93826.1 hypothetical protein CIK69_00925 [Brachybacterium alimentarium]
MSVQDPEHTVDRGSLQTSAIMLIVVGFLCGAMIPSVFGIIALVQLDSDSRSARQMTKIGWLIFWVLLGIGVLFIVGWLLVSLLMFGAVALPFVVGT